MCGNQNKVKNEHYKSFNFNFGFPLIWMWPSPQWHNLFNKYLINYKLLFIFISSGWNEENPNSIELNNFYNEIKNNYLIKNKFFDYPQTNGTNN